MCSREQDILDQTQTYRMKIAGFIIGFAVATCVMIATSQAMDGPPPPLLKEQITATSDFITLGDLFENVGDAANTAIFRSPDLGQQGMVRASRVKSAAERYGLVWPNPAGIETISIRRPSRLITIEQQKKLIRDTLAKKIGQADAKSLDITFASGAAPMHLPPKSTSDIIVKSLDYNRKSGQFKATVGLAIKQKDFRDTIFRGRAFSTQRLLVPAVTINPGTPITRESLKLSNIPNYKVRDGVAKTENQILGLASKRRLLPGQLILLTDLEQPRLVRKNAIVEIIFDRKGLAIKSEGRALENGSMGDAVRVTNTHSNKTIHATVIGPDLLTVSKRFTTLLANRLNRAKPLQQNNQNAWENYYRVR